MDVRKGCLIALGVSAVLFTAGIGYVAFRYFDIPQASMQIDSAVEKYRKAGLPWEAKELAPKPPVRAEENAAPLIRKASSALDLKLFRSSYRRIAGELDNGKPDTAAADLAPFEKAMALGIEASKRPRVDFGRDWDMGVDLLFPEETTVRTLVHLLGFRAELRAQRGDITGMISDVRAALRLSNLPTQEPTGIPLLATVSSQRLVFASIQRCGDTLQRNPAALRDLSQALEQEYRKPSFADALPGEAYMMVATVRNLELRRENESGESIPIDPRNLRRTGAPSNPFARAFMTRALQEWTEAKPIIDRYRDRPQKLAKELVVLDARWQNRPELSRILQDVLFSAYPEEGTAVAAGEADYLVADALLHALSLHASSGNFPARIEDIPGRWVDPFSDKPLILIASPAGIRIYSLGPNEADDGGKALSELTGTGRKDYDIAAASPPVKRKN